MKKKKFMFGLFSCLMFGLIGFCSVSAQRTPKDPGRYSESNPHHFIMAGDRISDVFTDKSGRTIDDIWSVTLSEGCINNNKDTIFDYDLYDTNRIIFHVPCGVNVKFTRLYNFLARIRCLDITVLISSTTNIDFTGILETETLFVPMAFIKFQVHPYNPKLSSTPEGVLFNKDKTVLYKFPNKVRGTYKIPRSVKRIEKSAFASCDLDKLYIPETVIGINEKNFINAYKGYELRMLKEKGYISNQGDCYNLRKSAIIDGCYGTMKNLINNIVRSTDNVYDNAQDNLYVEISKNDNYVHPIVYCDILDHRLPSVCNVINYSRSFLPQITKFKRGDSFFDITDTNMNGPVHEKFMVQTDIMPCLYRNTFDDILQKANSVGIFQEEVKTDNIDALRIQDLYIKIDHKYDKKLEIFSGDWSRLKTVYVDFKAKNKSKGEIEQNIQTMKLIMNHLPKSVENFVIISNKEVSKIPVFKDLKYNLLQREFFNTRNIAFHLIWDEERGGQDIKGEIHIDKNNKHKLCGPRKYSYQIGATPFGKLDIE